MSTRSRGRGGRGIAATALVLVNLVLVGLNLDKHDLLPVSTGLWSNDDSETSAGNGDSAADDSGGDTESPPFDDADGAPPTSDTALTDSVESDDGLVVETDVDDWPGGRGPVPDGPPVPRRADISADGRLVLTGSAPDWGTAMLVESYAAASMPDGAGAVDNQLTWHPEASSDPRSGTVIIEQAATFNIGETSIAPESFPSLDLAAELLVSRPTMFVVLIGHTDDVGDQEINAQLALERANAVVDYLVDAGVVPGQIVIAAAGEDDPTQSNETEEGREANRRVELQFKNFLIAPDAIGANAPADS